ALSCLKLFNKALHIGGDHFFRCLSLLRLFGVLGGLCDGVGGCDSVHGYFLLGLGRCFSCHAWHVPTCRTPPGEGGGSKAQWGGGSPILGMKRSGNGKGKAGRGRD